MRDYGTVSSQFWIGSTGKSLRGNAEAQLLALYLMTSPHSSMTGIFHCPVLYMAHETGLTMEGAHKALERLYEAGFCEYEEATEMVFVVKMAFHQIGPSLKAGDNRVPWLKKELLKLPETRFKSRFIDVYAEAYNLGEKPKKQTPSEGACDPLPSQEQEQEQEQEYTQDFPAADGDEPSGAKISRIGSMACPVQQIVDLYHSTLPELPRVQKLTDKRRKQIRARWLEHDTMRSLDRWKAFFEFIRESDFLMGRVDPAPGRPLFLADLEWITGASNFVKIVERKYHEKRAS